MNVYGKHALVEQTCQKWFEQFKNDDFGLDDEERSGRPKKVEYEELESLLKANYVITKYFKTAKSSRIHLKVRKLGASWIKAKRRW